MKPPDEFVEMVADALTPLGPVQTSRLFGGYSLKLDGIPFALISRGTLYLKADEALAASLIERGSAPFQYDTKTRHVVMASYYAVPSEGLDDAELLLDRARRSIAIAAKTPRPARMKKRR